MDIQLILVDAQDRERGYSTYEKCHKGSGQHHRAFVTLVVDKNNKVLLQKRKHRLFDGYWDFTAVSHPFFINNKEDSLQEASNRALKKEMGIPSVTVKDFGGFNYFAKDGQYCENEFCHVLIGNYDGEFKPSINDVYEAKKVGFDEFLVDIFKNPEKYTPWAILASRILKEKANLFKKELEKFLSVYNPYASKFYSKRIKETKNYSPIISNFYKDLANFSQGGKKLRAFLVYLGYMVGGGSSGIQGITLRLSRQGGIAQGTTLNSILPISLAFEMTQNFFLIHDDIMDKADLRRGKPTIHKVYEKKHGRHYGESMAITLGDIAAIETFKIISDSDFSVRQKTICLEEFSKVLLETAYGQSLDLEYSFEKADILQIYKIADLKAARYSVVAPLLIGASLAGAKDVQKDAVIRFGLNAGLAFQLQDDYLGLFGEEEIIGKSILSDMREGKNTLLIYKTREVSSALDKAKLDKIWGREEASMEDLKLIREIVVKSGARLWCENENKRLIRKAKREIINFTQDYGLQVIFGEIADYIASRAN